MTVFSSPVSSVYVTGLPFQIFGCNTRACANNDTSCSSSAVPSMPLINNQRTPIQLLPSCLLPNSADSFAQHPASGGAPFGGFVA